MYYVLAVISFYTVFFLVSTTFMLYFPSNVVVMLSQLAYIFDPEALAART